MPRTDSPLFEIEGHLPPQTAEPDFDEFWQTTLTETAAVATPAEFVAESTGLQLKVESVRFSGYGIAGWLVRPLDADELLPCVVTFSRYGGGLGRPVSRTMLPFGGLRPVL